MTLLQSDLAMNTPNAEIERRCSGCLTPPFDTVLDYIMGVHVRPACCLHDFEYVTQTISRSTADHYFLLNLRTLIDDSDLGWIHKQLAYKTALGYYLFVRAFGGMAWEG